MFDTYLFTRISTKNEIMMKGIRVFLENKNLSIDNNVEFFVVAYSEECIIGCGGIANNILKSIAIVTERQGSGFFLKLMSELTNLAYEMGRYHLFLFTKPSNVKYFRQAGFFQIANAGEKLSLLENTKNGLEKYCNKLKQWKISGDKIGSIVLNANPFTLGHQFLVEKAANECDGLHLFVVQEEGNEFSYHDRFEMIKLGTQHIPNLILHPGSEYIISRATFPTYFIKDKGIIDYCHTAVDLQIFRNHIAPALGITHRYIGTEPQCIVTHNYNQQMQQWLTSPLLESPKIEVIEVARITINNNPISASIVRALLLRGETDNLINYLPQTTIEYLNHHTVRELVAT
ncbi:[citrate (pro-3S)-lyase] ligase [Photobacterium carnosum]|uniref:[citrate (pro-3S)-lyase] ligase n=1 Tax=Photobacterium carnosum TaxID=2023717 RepID=UPI001E323338|nr:[citrate (pro-3S)-lyase] ligase [Photobacterium carnosum]MCD9496586.1 [citrate (pro-3S)-lyase] ligase [Photobacterium carnosum]